MPSARSPKLHRLPPPLPESLAARFLAVRARTRALAASLTPEDCALQSMPDASPVKWHLAHVTWFFETFVLAEHLAGYAAFDPAFRVLFNSYYHGVGDRHPRAERGLVSRPDLATVLAYRSHVEAAMTRLFAAPVAPGAGGPGRARAAARAAAPGAHPHRLEAPAVAQSRAAGLPPALAARARAAAAARLARVRRRIADARPRRRGLRVRQRAPRAPRVRAAVRARVAPGDPWRVRGVHRGRRLSPARAVAVAGLGCGAGARLGGAAVLGARRRTAGGRSRCTAWPTSTRARRCATSATSRPTPTRAGPARGFPPSSNGSTRRRRCR